MAERSRTLITISATPLMEPVMANVRRVADQKCSALRRLGAAQHPRLRSLSRGRQFLRESRHVWHPDDGRRSSVDPRLPRNDRQRHIRLMLAIMEYPLVRDHVLRAELVVVTCIQISIVFRKCG